MKTAIIGAGWAGMAAAVSAADAGDTVSVWEAGRTLGGRARALPARLPDGSETLLDNGQHILIGAYSETLRLMCHIGLDPTQLLLRLPLTLQFPDGGGIRFTHWPAPLDALAGIVSARGWSLADKFALARAALRWRLDGFCCAPTLTVAQLCRSLSPRVMAELIEPLCVSALNTPANGSSGQVFLTVMRDAVFGARNGSNLLLPRVDLSTMFPDAAARWLTARGHQVRTASRVRQLEHDGTRWRVDGAGVDQVVLATAAPDALHVLDASMAHVTAQTAQGIRTWADMARALPHAAITTVYAWGQGAALARPMLALRCGADHDTPLPAQFVFDRGQLGGPPGLMAFVVSASDGDRDTLQSQVLEQARLQLGLTLQPIRTVVEKRATLMCIPGLRRPPMEIAPGLRAVGDYIDGPYPSTLEGAVRSGMAVVHTRAVERLQVAGDPQ